MRISGMLIDEAAVAQARQDPARRHHHLDAGRRNPLVDRGIGVADLVETEPRITRDVEQRLPLLHAMVLHATDEAGELVLRGHARERRRDLLGHLDGLAMTTEPEEAHIPTSPRARRRPPPTLRFRVAAPDAQSQVVA